LAQIAEDADDEIQYMKESLRHEIRAASEGLSEEARQEQLKKQSRDTIQALRDRLDQNYEKNSLRKK